MKKCELCPEADFGEVRFRCPGCLGIHVIPTEGPKAWEFNKNFEQPTLKPSILARQHRGGDPKPDICHSFVTDVDTINKIITVMRAHDLGD
jgi:hypothetical protein